MIEPQDTQPAARTTRKIIHRILLCSAVIACIPAAAQVSPGPALRGKGNMSDAQREETSRKLKEDDAQNKARLLELKERIKRENAKRGIVPSAERMKPAGSNPAPSPGNPNPVRK
jgi:hypothetical protein